MKTKALITGITGQDGSYLTELLLSKGYEVHGVVRRTSSLERSRLRHLYLDASVYGENLFLHYADLEDPTNIRRILNRVQPDEVYHLAGQSHVGISFEIAESTCESTAMATLRLLEMIRDMDPMPRLFHPASSELFGRPDTFPQDENTPWRPVNPYGCAKAFAARMVSVFREEFGLFASNGIMYNHESPRRGENFVTRKICHAAAAIKLGLKKELVLGDLEARRDWGHSRDYVEGMWLTLQHAEADDFVFATGTLHSVKDVVVAAFEHVGLDWQKHVRTDERFLRHGEPAKLVGNPEKARRILKWSPRTQFGELIQEMTQAELDGLSGR